MRRDLALLPEIDVTVDDHGTVLLFTAVSAPGKAWVAENVEPEPWQWLGPGFAVDHRLGIALAEAMEVDGGLRVEWGVQ